MKVVALIPIKLGSKRVPKKNIKPFFDGTPLMSFIQKRISYVIFTTYKILIRGL